MDVLVFDIWGDYGHFRKFYTTSSPLSFAFPPPPTVAGILGAICGVGKDEYLRVFSPEKTRIGIRLLNPVKKTRMGINFSETKGSNLRVPMSDKNLAPRTQIRVEFVKAPSYRIYIYHEDRSIISSLENFLKAHKTVFTISLGLSELLADFRFIGIYGAEKISNNDNFLELTTVFSSEQLLPEGLAIEEGKKYFKERIPVAMTSDRVVKKYSDVIFESQGKTIKAKLKEAYRLSNGEIIALF